MFGTLGGPELFLIFVVALIVFGPRKLPEIGKSLGKMMAEFRKASNDFRNTIESEVEAEKIRESMRIEPPEGRAGRRARPGGGARAPTRPRPGGGRDGRGRADGRARGGSGEPREHAVRRGTAVAEPPLDDASASRQDDVPRAPRGAAPAPGALVRLPGARLRRLLGLPRADLPLHGRADAQGRLRRQVHLHRPGRGVHALHEDGLLRGHLRGGALHPVGGLGLHLAGALQEREGLGGAVHRDGHRSSSPAARSSATTSCSR